MSESFALRTTVSAPPERVFRALMDPRDLEENLSNQLEGRPVSTRCDFSAPMAGEARAQVEIDAPPERVFAALTEPEQLERWIAERATVEPRVGGRYDFGWDHGPSRSWSSSPPSGSRTRGAGRSRRRSSAGSSRAPAGARG